MRLSSTEQTLIKTIVLQAGGAGTLYLFGSRADDARKGGDIDLFFEPSRQISLKDQLRLQYRLATACGTSVDLTIKNPAQANTVFFDHARSGIRL